MNSSVKPATAAVQTELILQPFAQLLLYGIAEWTLFWSETISMPLHNNWTAHARHSSETFLHVRTTAGTNLANSFGKQSKLRLLCYRRPRGPTIRCVCVCVCAFRQCNVHNCGSFIRSASKVEMPWGKVGVFLCRSQPETVVCALTHRSLHSK